MARTDDDAYRDTHSTSGDRGSATPDTDADTTGTRGADRVSSEAIAYARAVHGIARSGGDGARSATEEWVHQHSRPESNDGRSPTRTTFYASDADTIGPGQRHRDPEDRTSWNRLAKWQDGVQSDISRGGQNWAADKERWFDTFASHVEATDRQEKRARHIVEAVPMEPFQGARIPIEWVIVGALSIAIDEDARSLATRAIEREAFAGLVADLEMDRGDLRDVRQKLRAEL